MSLTFDRLLYNVIEHFSSTCSQYETCLGNNFIYISLQKTPRRAFLPVKLSRVKRSTFSELLHLDQLINCQWNKIKVKCFQTFASILNVYKHFPRHKLSLSLYMFGLPVVTSAYHERVLYMGLKFMYFSVNICGLRAIVLG